MNLYFSHHIFSTQAFGGISRYFVELARELDQERNDLTIKIVSPFFVNSYLPELPSSLFIGRKAPRPKRGLRVLTGINQALSIAYFAAKSGIYHETYYNRFSALKASSSFAKVTTVYDCIHEIFPDQFSPRDHTSKLKKETVDRADLVLCVSDSTKKDLIQRFNVNPQKIRVTHLGFTPMKIADQQTPFAENRPDRPYLLFVGNRGIYKNGRRMMEAFASSIARREGMLLVFFGGESVSQAERDWISSNGLEQQIVFVRGDDKKLAQYYQGATAFVFPSLYEGFGLPLLEAMSAGCPVLCSNTSSFPEVARDAALYFDPTQVEAITSALNEFINDSTLRDHLIKKGFENIRDFTWKKCANLTLSAYKELN